MNLSVIARAARDSIMYNRGGHTVDGKPALLLISRELYQQVS